MRYPCAFRCTHLLPVLLAAALCLMCAATDAMAVDYRISGVWQIGFEQSNVMPRHSRHSHNDSFTALQRFRTQLDVIASEALSGTVQIEMGRTEWGRAAQGGALGADGTGVKVRFAYLDWMIPETPVKVRMGLQTLLLPGILSQWGFGPIFGKEMAGIAISSPICSGDSFNVDATAFWARPYNDNSSNDFPDRTDNQLLDNLDAFALTIPVSSDRFRVTPYGMYTLIGQYSLSGVNAAMGDSGIVAPRGGLMPVLGGGRYYQNYFEHNGLTRLSRAWGDGFWGGLVADIHLTDNLRLGFEGAYGSVDMGDVKNYQGFNDGKNRTLHVRRAGWYAGARLDYTCDWGVPGILGWYGSGDDDDPYNGSERLPQFNTPWGVSSLGFGGGAFDEFTWKLLGHNPSGIAAVIAQVDRLSFIDDLSHTVRLGFYTGTNSPKMPKRAGMSWPTRADGPSAYLTKTDTAWEANLISHYKIYENFDAALDMAYVRLNLDNDTWHGKEDDMWEDNYHIGLAFTYKF